MNRPPLFTVRFSFWIFFARAWRAASAGALTAAAAFFVFGVSHGAAAEDPTEDRRFHLSDLLPTAWQKRPGVLFNVFTEMTPAGRAWRQPTPDKPLTYFAPAGTYTEIGWQIIAGEKPPPWRELHDAMQKALAGNGFVAIAGDTQRPDLLIVFSYGSFSTDLALLATEGPGVSGPPVFPPPATAGEMLPYLFHDPSAVQDVFERARFIGGAKVAEEFRLGLFWGNVVDLLDGSAGENVRHVLELAFHTCYFVTASAFDFTGVEKKQKRLLWQTRMTIEAQGVDMREVLKPLIINTGAFLGRETPEAVVLKKRLDRQGNVEIGETRVVPDNGNAPPPTAKK